VAATFGEAFAKAQLAAGQVLPTGGTVFFSVNDPDKPAVVELVRSYVNLGFKIVATEAQPMCWRRLASLWSGSSRSKRAGLTSWT